MNGKLGPIVALSVSDGPDLGRFGYLERHLRQVLGEVMVTLLRAGLRVGYGGDLRKDGYTRELFEALSAAYARNRLVPGARPAIVHYFASSSWGDAEPEDLARHLKEIHTIAETRFCNPNGDDLAYFATEEGFRRVDPSSGETWPARRNEVFAELAAMEESARSTPPATALTAMRQTMAAETLMRVVASGRVSPDKKRASDPKRWMPGIIEEALLHARAGRIVVPLGAFGGASRDVAVALGLLPERARVRYAEIAEMYEPALAKLAGLATVHRERVESAGLWRELAVLAEADDPVAIAAGVQRIASGAQPES